MKSQSHVREKSHVIKEIKVRSINADVRVYEYVWENLKLKRNINAVDIKKRMKNITVSPKTALLLKELKIVCDLVKVKKLDGIASVRVL
jgi:hypothetical protein